MQHVSPLLRAREGLETAILLGLEHGCDTTSVWNARPENQRTGTAGASGSSKKFAHPEPVPPSRGAAFGTFSLGDRGPIGEIQRVLSPLVSKGNTVACAFTTILFLMR
jgi:hypothetical protein